MPIYNRRLTNEKRIIGGVLYEHDRENVIGGTIRRSYRAGALHGRGYTYSHSGTLTSLHRSIDNRRCGIQIAPSAKLFPCIAMMHDGSSHGRVKITGQQTEVFINGVERK